MVMLPGGDLEGASPGAAQSTSPLEKKTRAALAAGLSQIGYEAIPAEAARAQLVKQGKLSLCRNILSCDRRAVLDALDADALAVYALWLKAGQPSQLTISLTRKDFEGSSSREVTGASLEQETKALLAAALTKAEQPTRVLVQIDSDPQGATVTMDQQEKKTAPAQFQLAPGRHQLAVEKAGYVTIVDTLELTSDDASYRQTISLEKVSASQAAAQAPSPSPPTQATSLDTGYQPPQEHSGSPLADYVLGAVFATGAGSLLAVGIVYALRDGRCIKHEGSGGACVQRDDSHLWPVWMGGAAASAIASGAMFWLTPIANLTTETAGLQLSGRF